MSKWKRVLIPLDGSDVSEWVLSRAAGLFERLGVSVTLLTVAEADEARAADLGYRVSPVLEEIRGRLHRHRSSLEERAIPAMAEIRYGDPATEILREIASGGHDLVVMATHGREGMGRMLFGSVAEKVLKVSPVAILMFRPMQRPDETVSPAETREPARFRKILVPLDGSGEAEEILPAAQTLAEMFGSKLCLFRAVPGGEKGPTESRVAEEYLQNWHRRLGGHDQVSTVAIRTGSAATEALAAIAERTLDAVAMTTHGRSGAARALYGSVADRLLREAEVPILLIRNSRLRDPMPAPAEPFRHSSV